MQDVSPAPPNSISHPSGYSDKYKEARSASLLPRAVSMAQHHQPEEDPRDPQKKAAFPSPREEQSDRMEGNPSTSRQCNHPPRLSTG